MKALRQLAILFGLLFIAASAHAVGLTKVQAGGNSYDSNTGSCLTITSCAWSMMSSVSTGDAIVVSVDTNGSGSVALAGSGIGCATTTWIITDIAAGPPEVTQYAGIASGNGTCTLTASLSAASNIGIVYIEYSNPLGSPIDIVGSLVDSTTTTPTFSASGTTATTNEQAIVSWSDGNTAAGASASGWTSEVNQSFSGMFDRSVAVSGSTVTFTGANYAASHTSSLVMVLLKPAGALVPGPPGWTRLPGTALGGGPENSSYCADTTGLFAYTYTGNCTAIYTSWGSAVADTKRNRLLFWGGGHGDYGGNEIYSLDLFTSPPQMLLLNQPSANPNNPACAGSPILPDGRPDSVHPYDQIGYLPDQDEFISAGGGGWAPCDGSEAYTWTLALNSIVDSCAPSCSSSWTNEGTVAYSGSGYQQLTAYDSVRHLFWEFDGVNLWSFDPTTNVTTKTAPSIANTGIASTGLYDPVDQLFVGLGNDNMYPGDGTSQSLFYISTASGSSYTFNTPGIDSSCSAILPTGFVGAAWDPVEKRFVLSPNTGTNNVYVLDPHTWKCYTEQYGSTKGTDYPQDKASSVNGNFKRFNYFPAYDVFVLCNDPANDCWVLRRRR